MAKSAVNLMRRVIKKISPAWLQERLRIHKQGQKINLKPSGVVITRNRVGAEETTIKGGGVKQRYRTIYFTTRERASRKKVMRGRPTAWREGPHPKRLELQVAPPKIHPKPKQNATSNRHLIRSPKKI